MSKISFQRRGNGSPVVLLHGFPMNRRVWDDFAEKLAKEYSVFTPDLSGFGESELLPLPFTIDTVADALCQWIDEAKIGSNTLIGHSLGGYVALAMVEKNGSLFNGLGLFHSTAFADNEEKKLSRNKVLEFIENNGVTAFTSGFIKPLFADQNNPAIDKVKSISLPSTAEAVKGYTVAMRDRPDRSHVLKNFKKPVLFITGDKDPGIPVESVTQQSALPERHQLVVLENCAHMGMFEKPKESLHAVRSFLRQI